MTYRFSAHAFSLFHGSYYFAADGIQNLLREIALATEADFIGKYGQSGDIPLIIGASTILIEFATHGSIIYVSDLRRE